MPLVYRLLHVLTNTMKEYELPTPRATIQFIYADNDGIIWFPNNNIGMIIIYAQ
jgi:streptogramin lyase